MQEGGNEVLIGLDFGEITFLIFQLALARRRLQDIAEAGDMASLVWFREFSFVHQVITDVHSLLRTVKKSWLDAPPGSVVVASRRDESSFGHGRMES